MQEKIKIPTTKYHMMADVISAAVLGAIIVMLIMSWSNLPDKMPIHFNMKGEADGWGGKGNLIFMMVLNIGMYGLMCVIEKFPQIWNTGVALTEKNREAVYIELKNMMVTIKMVMVMIVSYAIYASASLKGISFMFTPLVLLATIGTSIFFLIRIFYVAKKAKEKV